MYRRALQAFAAVAAPLISLCAPTAARAEEGYRVSGPVTHGNLTVYFVHGASRPGPVPLTLVYLETRRTDGSWVHRTYVAK